MSRRRFVLPLTPLIIFSYSLVICTFFSCRLSFVSAVLDRSIFPSESEIPPVDHPLVREWLSQIDLSGAPVIGLNSGDPPDCPSTVDEGVCYWTCEDCSADDVINCPDANSWGLTFDDGPTPATPELLTFLKQQQVKATFFLIGSNVVKYPHYVVQEVQAGHHLASHTWSHHALTTLSNEQIVAEIKWTEKAIEDATGYRVRYMRPPYGDIDNRVRYILKQLGYRVVDWSGDTFDTNDWKMPEISAPEVTSKFMESIDTYTSPSANNTNGFISLEHDLTSETVNIAKILIPYGLERNLNIMTVPECLHDTSPYASSPLSLRNNSTNTTSPFPIPPSNLPEPNQAGSNGRINASGLDLKHANSASRVHGEPSLGKLFISSKRRKPSRSWNKHKKMTWMSTVQKAACSALILGSFIAVLASL